VTQDRYAEVALSEMHGNICTLAIMSTLAYHSNGVLLLRRSFVGALLCPARHASASQREAT
jgi:hypothetical protein